MKMINSLRIDYAYKQMKTVQYNKACFEICILDMYAKIKYPSLESYKCKFKVFIDAQGTTYSLMTS